MQHSDTPKTTLLMRLIPIRILLITSLSLVFPTERLFAFEISAGAGALEEGDDRARPAAVLHLSFANNWLSRTSIWGRSFGPVTETAGILSVAKRYDIFGSKSLGSVIGVSALAEKTSIKYHDHPEENSSYTSTNAGMMLGLHYSLFTSKTIKVAASWDAHVFPAGSAILYLVTARKQIIGLTAGVSL